MIVLRQKEFGNKEPIELQAAKEQYRLRHNGRIYKGETEELDNLTKKYKGKLTNYDEYDKKVQGVVDKTEGNWLDSVRATGRVAKNVISSAKYALGPKKVLNKENLGTEHAKVTVRERGLKERFSGFRDSVSNLGEQFNDQREGLRQERGYKIAEKTIKSPEQSKYDKEYEAKAQEIMNKYKPRYL